jgi:hypothetical protein
MDDERKRRILEEVKAHDRIVADVMAGKTVTCGVCGQPLKYYGVDSGRHPGIYCGNGCTEILMTVKKAD